MVDFNLENDEPTNGTLDLHTHTLRFCQEKYETYQTLFEKLYATTVSANANLFSSARTKCFLQYPIHSENLTKNVPSISFQCRLLVPSEKDTIVQQEQSHTIDSLVFIEVRKPSSFFSLTKINQKEKEKEKENTKNNKQQKVKTHKDRDLAQNTSLFSQTIEVGCGFCFLPDFWPIQNSVDTLFPICESKKKNKKTKNNKNNTNFLVKKRQNVISIANKEDTAETRSLFLYFLPYLDLFHTDAYDVSSSWLCVLSKGNEQDSALRLSYQQLMELKEKWKLIVRPKLNKWNERQKKSHEEIPPVEMEFHLTKFSVYSFLLFMKQNKRMELDSRSLYLLHSFYRQHPVFTRLCEDLYKALTTSLQREQKDPNRLFVMDEENYLFLSSDFHGFKNRFSNKPTGSIFTHVALTLPWSYDLHLQSWVPDYSLFWLSEFSCKMQVFGSPNFFSSIETKNKIKTETETKTKIENENENENGNEKENLKKIKKEVDTKQKKDNTLYHSSFPSFEGTNQTKTQNDNRRDHKWAWTKGESKEKKKKVEERQEIPTFAKTRYVRFKREVSKKPNSDILIRSTCSKGLFYKNSEIQELMENRYTLQCRYDEDGAIQAQEEVFLLPFHLLFAFLKEMKTLQKGTRPLRWILYCSFAVFFFVSGFLIT